LNKISLSANVPDFFHFKKTIKAGEDPIAKIND